LLVAAERVQIGLRIHELHMKVMASNVIHATASVGARNVSPMYYLWIPMLTGAVLVIVLVWLTGFIGVPCLAVTRQL
jgi:hypothetical protein